MKVSQYNYECWIQFRSTKIELNPFRNQKHLGLYIAVISLDWNNSPQFQHYVRISRISKSEVFNLFFLMLKVQNSLTKFKIKQIYLKFKVFVRSRKNIKFLPHVSISSFQKYAETDNLIRPAKTNSKNMRCFNKLKRRYFRKTPTIRRRDIHAKETFDRHDGFEYES